jgi:hypothetical protein
MGVRQPRKVSKEELLKIDAHVPIAFAKACHRNDVQQMSVLSSVGSNVNCKGTMEETIKDIPFPVHCYSTAGHHLSRQQQYAIARGKAE